MNNYILAIHAGHNACALIGNENGVQYAIQEERLTGEKNYWGFPNESIKACLKRYNLTPDSIKKVVFGANQIFTRYHSRKDLIYSYKRQDTIGGKIRQRFLMPMALKLLPKYGQKDVTDSLKKIGFDANKIKFFDHHTSHAASAYYGLRKNYNEDYLVVTCDGSGDDLCATIRIMGPGGKDEIVATTQWDNSLGALYSWTTYRMGFIPLEHEYKLMGMASYTSPKYSKEISDIFKSFLWLDNSGLSFKRKSLKRVNDLSRDIFTRLDGTRFDAVCGGLQIFTEELLTEWINNAIEKTGIKKVLAAGGVFMNVKANKRISELTNLENFEAFPSCGDETLPFGAFYQELANRIGGEKISPLKNLYLGDVAVIDLKKNTINQKFKVEKYENTNVEVAKLLAKGIPVARCVGRMEFGARALGNRSILADPENQDVVRVINQMVKKRDFWMPFAPLLKKEKGSDYIKNPGRV